MRLFIQTVNRVASLTFETRLEGLMHTEGFIYLRQIHFALQVHLEVQLL